MITNPARGTHENKPKVTIREVAMNRKAFSPGNWT
jgi:hypothetical protein